MPPNTANGGRSGKKKDTTTTMDSIRGACPPHKIKDLDKLVKQMKGDEAKIMERIQEWWDEPVNPAEEEEWEDVNKKTAKKKQESPGGGGGRGGRGGRSGGGAGRSGRGRDRGGGRGDRASRDRDRQGRGRGDDKRQAKPVAPKEAGTAEPVHSGPVPTAPIGVPAPSNAPVLKGAWGARAAAADPPAPASQDPPPAEKLIPVESKEPLASPSALVPEINPLDAGPVSQISLPSVKASEAKPTLRGGGGNVWATKGSAHLIKAEKVPSPAPAPLSQSAPVVEKENPALSIPEAAAAPTLTTGLPSGVATGGSAWSSSPQPTQPAPAATPIEMPPHSPAISRGIAPHSPAGLPEPVVEQMLEPISSASAAASPAVQKVLNMGHWESGGGDDPSDIDFGFGFGAGSNDATAPPPAPKEVAASAATTAASPARPPPGLTIGGMPPMPASAVMVHELEKKLESTSLNAPTTSGAPPSAPVPAGMSGVQSHNGGFNPNQVLPPGIAQQNYNQHQQYGAPSMYSYNAAVAPTGFAGMAAPVLAGGVVPQQQPKSQVAGGLSGPVQTAPPNLAPQGLYGAQAPSASQAMNPPNDPAGNTDGAAASSAPSGGVPPGMPGSIPYGNPAIHYGQHQFYMGQHQGGIGYNYGYGQFGGVAQGGFGYQPSMGHNQGYGGPHYDDQGHQGNSHHSGGSGGYQNKGGGGGGYRGRNNHHNNNQYQNQYNPQQHGGYGGQPYGMGYHQHGPSGMGDPYAMQHQEGMGGGGFQDDDQQKGRKGPRGGMNSFQHGQPQLGGQQPFGLQQQQGGVDSAPTSGGGSWSNQGGGWSGGAQSGGWQGN